MNEYEVLRDGRNTIAVTLLRSVGELGDWGHFPTPEAQCLGEHTVHLEIIPHSGDGVEAGAYQEAYQFQIPWTAAQTGQHEGAIDAVHAPYAWEADNGLAFSAWKVSEHTGDDILRWYNMKRETADLKLELTQGTASMYKTTILEEDSSDKLATASARAELAAGACEVVTVGVRRQS